jgi:hypothetical protein
MKSAKSSTDFDIKSSSKRRTITNEIAIPFFERDEGWEAGQSIPRTCFQMATSVSSNFKSMVSFVTDAIRPSCPKAYQGQRRKQTWRFSSLCAGQGLLVQPKDVEFKAHLLRDRHPVRQNLQKCQNTILSRLSSLMHRSRTRYNPSRCLYARHLIIRPRQRQLRHPGGRAPCPRT